MGRGGLEELGTLGRTVLGGQGWSGVGGLCGRGYVENHGTVVCTDVLSNPHFCLWFLSLQFMDHPCLWSPARLPFTPQ